jgi:Fe-S cluster biogenesis protein NfuA
MLQALNEKREVSMTDETKAKISETLDKEIRPNLQADGGDVELVSVGDDGVVQLRLTGACGPSAALELFVIVKQKIKRQTRKNALD